MSESFGYSAVAFLMTASYSASVYSLFILWGISYSYRALIRAFCIVFSPAAIFKLPSTHLTINLTSSSTPLINRLTKMLYFSALELLPLALAIFLKLEKTLSMVKGSFVFFLVKMESRVR